MSPGSSDRRVRKCVRMRSQENSKKRQNAEMGWFAENLSKCSETSRVRSGGIGFREVLLGRDAGIRTRDPLNPIQVRYQTAPRPDRGRAFEQDGRRAVKRADSVKSLQPFFGFSSSRTISFNSLIT